MTLDDRIIGETILQLISSGKGPVVSGNTRGSRQRDRQKSKLAVAASSRKPGKKK
jgi:hypothetical protein